MGGKFMKKESSIYLPYIIIRIFILMIPFILILIISNHYYITKYYVNKKYPNQVVSLENDLIHDINKNKYIDLRNSVKEDFDRIIIINLNYNISDFTKEYGINFDKLEIELPLDTIRNIAENKEKIEDFQLIMFFNKDKLIRYQELRKSNTYYFPVTKSKEYKNTYIFAPSSQNKSILIPYRN